MNGTEERQAVLEPLKYSGKGQSEEAGISLLLSYMLCMCSFFLSVKEHIMLEILNRLDSRF